MQQPLAIAIVSAVYGMTIWADPVTVRYVACTIVVPEATPVTMPVEEIVAIAVSDDCHVA
jgi:hypothetical protein